MSDDVTQPIQPPAGPELTIHTIPMEFYGGKNPGGSVESMPQTTVPTASQPSAPLPIVIPEKPKLPPKPVVSVQPAPVGATTTTLKPPRPAWVIPVIVAGIAVVLGGGGTLAYFVFKPQPPSPEPQPPQIAVVSSTESVATTTVEESTKPPEPIVAPKSASLIAPHTFTDSLDGDSDGVTDVEEELWLTNPTVADTDGDTYPDGVELRNLYNPIGVAPQRLVDAGVVSTYVNSAYKYTALYPKPWLAQDVDAEKKETIFTAVSGEFVAINVLEFPTTIPFTQWFAEQFPGEQLATYTAFTNRMKVAGMLSADGAVALFTDGAQVYLLRYDGGSRAQINYRVSFHTMVQSFKPANVATPIEFLPKSVVAPTAEIIPLETLLASSTVSSTVEEVPVKIEAEAPPTSSTQPTASSTATAAP